jgi:hypothetical protein
MRIKLTPEQERRRRILAPGNVPGFAMKGET